MTWDGEFMVDKAANHGQDSGAHIRSLLLCFIAALPQAVSTSHFTKQAALRTSPAPSRQRTGGDQPSDLQIHSGSSTRQSNHRPCSLLSLHAPRSPLSSISWSSSAAEQYRASPRSTVWTGTAQRSPRNGAEGQTAIGRFASYDSGQTQPASPSHRRRSGTGFGVSPTPNFGSLLGSYEESLLAGRMSSAPSRPLQFDAELGVVGHGARCPTSLKCPPHLCMQFPACFYSSETSGGHSAIASAPYVGTIDLESHYWARLLSCDPVRLGSPAPEIRGSSSFARSLPAFPGYRVPPKGQIQLIVKNPNRTAVKLFLVPYDLTDLAPGSKTIIRQKSLASVPAKGAEAVKGCNKNATRTNDADSQPPLPTKETLRYAIQLQFCSPPNHKTHGRSCTVPMGPASAESRPPPAASSCSRIYLHKSIRVVFAPRAPDRSEKLHVVTEIFGGSAVTFAGPGDEWTQARRTVRDNVAAYRHEGRQLSGDAEFTRGRTIHVAVHRSEEYLMPNSDPNGERWVEREEGSRSLHGNSPSKEGVSSWARPTDLRADLLSSSNSSSTSPRSLRLALGAPIDTKLVDRQKDDVEQQLLDAWHRTLARSRPSSSMGLARGDDINSSRRSSTDRSARGSARNGTSTGRVSDDDDRSIVQSAIGMSTSAAPTVTQGSDPMHSLQPLAQRQSFSQQGVVASCVGASCQPMQRTHSSCSASERTSRQRNIADLTLSLDSLPSRNRPSAAPSAAAHLGDGTTAPLRSPSLLRALTSSLVSPPVLDSTIASASTSLTDMHSFDSAVRVFHARARAMTLQQALATHTSADTGKKS